MTHRPPKGILDECNNFHAGCDNLLCAASRARPLLYCFGHIREGHGAKIVTWKEDMDVVGQGAIDKEKHLHSWSFSPSSIDPPIKFGRKP
jgi:hypothetical protein